MNAWAEKSGDVCFVNLKVSTRQRVNVSTCQHVNCRRNRSSHKSSDTYPTIASRPFPIATCTTPIFQLTSTTVVEPNACYLPLLWCEALESRTQAGKLTMFSHCCHRSKVGSTHYRHLSCPFVPFLQTKLPKHDIFNVTFVNTTAALPSLHSIDNDDHGVVAGRGPWTWKPVIGFITPHKGGGDRSETASHAFRFGSSRQFFAPDLIAVIFAEHCHDRANSP